jgi:nitroreductase
MNSQEIDIYVALPQGLYLYEPQPHDLRLVSGDDVRAKTSGQPFATNAPATLVFVADLTRLNKAKSEQRPIYAAIDTGYISQNVYLFCASEGLATVVHELDHGPLAAAMNLHAEQKIVLAQAIGFPAEVKPQTGNADPK